MNFATIVNAVSRILQTPFQLDGVTLTFEAILLFLGFIAIICFLIGGLFK